MRVLHTRLVGMCLSSFPIHRHSQLLYYYTTTLLNSIQYPRVDQIDI